MGTKIKSEMVNKNICLLCKSELVNYNVTLLYES